MRTQFAAASLGLALLLFGPLEAQTPTPTDTAARARDAVVRALQINARSANLETFGRGIERQVLLAAAAQLKAGKVGPFTVQVPVRVDILPPRVGAGVPPRASQDPNDLDVCYQLSTGIHDYIQCSAPDIPGMRPPHIVTCDELRAQFVAAEGSAKVAFLIQLIDFGCIDWTKFRLPVTQ